jgi:dimethylaniline monooxygenase (N-oxide forming)
MAPKVAVIGMGPLGLLAMKTFKEDGFEVHGFDKRTWVGGLWKQSYDSSLSVTPQTVFNSSRFRCAISDFPFGEDDEVDDFPTAPQVWQYFERYCDHFDLRPSITFGAEIKTYGRQDDKWALEYVKDSQHHTEYFDKLAIAIGSFMLPRSPKLNGIENFQGQTLHSLNFPSADKFKGHNVLLIGLHATAQDLVVELSPYAKKVFIAHKNGINLMPRYTEDGKTYDQTQNLSLMLIQVFMEAWFPRIWCWFIDSFFQKMMKQNYPGVKPEWKLTPPPSLETTPPLIADAIWPHLESGFAEPCDAVARITGPKTIELTDGRILTDIDTIIYTTGYESAIPFAPDEFNPYPIRDDAAYLYRGMFPLHSDHDVRNSLAFLGLGGIPFPGFIQWELWAQALSQTWLSRRSVAKLPPLAEMKKWHANHMAWRVDVMRRCKYDTKFFTAFMRSESLVWLDKVTGSGVFAHFGFWSWRSWWFWATDRSFYKECMNGLASPAIWRLFDMGGRKPWSGAREQVKKDNAFAKKRQEERLEALKKEKANGVEAKKGR